MMELKFFKNNKELEIKSNNIKFDPLTLIITKEEEDYIIILDFMKKECFMHLKEKNQRFSIEVLNMDYEIDENLWIFNYELASEENAENRIEIRL